MATFDFLQAVYSGSTLEQYFFFFGAIFVGIVGAKILYFFIKKYGTMITSRTESEFDDMVIEAIETPLIFAGFIAGLIVGYHFLTPDIEFIKSNFFNAVNALVILNLAWFSIKMVDGIIDHFLIPLSSKTKSKLDDQLIPVVRKVLKVSIILLAIVIILSSFGIDILPLLAGLGIGGLAIAFAAQKTVEDLFGGLSIFASKPFVVGDTVTVKGITGEVKAVGMRYTRIKDADGRIVTLPNAQVAQDAITNISSEQKKRAQLTLVLDHSTSGKKIEEATEIIRDTLKSHPKTDHSDINAVFRNYLPTGYEIWVAYFVTDKDNFVKIVGEINLEIKKRFEKAKIVFSSPATLMQQEAKK